MSIKQTVEELSEAAVLVERSDLQALASLHTKLEEIETWAKDNGQPQVGEVAAKAAKSIEQIILEEESDPDAAFSSVCRAIAALQQVLCDERRLESGMLPPEYEIEVGGRDSAEETTSQSQPSPHPELPKDLNPYVDEALFSEFLSRQIGALAEMEEFILALEKSLDETALGGLRGLLHTLKGEAAVMGLSDVSNVCHAVEDKFEREPANEITDMLLETKDWLLRMLESYSGKGSAPEAAENLLARWEVPPASGMETPDLAQSALEEEQPPESPPEPAPAPPQETVPPQPAPQPAPAESAPKFVPIEGDVGLLSDFVTEAREHLDTADVHLLTLETNSTDEESLNAVFRAFHTIKGVAGFLSLDDIQSVAHEAENLLDRARKGQLLLVDNAIDVTFEALDALKRLVEQLGSALQTGEALVRDPSLPSLVDRIQAVLAGKAAPPPSAEQTAPVAEPQQAPSAPPPAEPEPPAPAAPAEEEPAAEKPPAPKDAEEKADKQAQSQRSVKIRESVKVDAERLDLLVEMIGELVITESMVSQSVEEIDNCTAELARHVKQLRKITRELQEMGTSLRMIPIRATFQKMARVARDLSRKTGKPLEFITSGEDTELDKTVVDRISDPLVHLVRNAVDHGLEDGPVIRKEAGKSETGLVNLRAFHRGGNIYIEISDDGRGLNRDAILNKARERGLISDGDAFSDRDVYNLIFEPGFSTAKTVTDVSGRGVGMDVVKRNILALRGQIDIQSEVGKGATFTIRLPLTLAIIDGMVVRIGEQRYIIPTLSIVQSVQPRTAELSTVLNTGEMAHFQNRHVPLFRLADLFNIQDAERDPTKGIVVVVEDGDELAGLLVDDLVGQHQIVIKSLGEFFQGIPGVAGGAIMSDGRVGLILDVGALVRLAN